jgi:hypothetical protein
VQCIRGFICHCEKLNPVQNVRCCTRRQDGSWRNATFNRVTSEAKKCEPEGNVQGGGTSPASPRGGEELLVTKIRNEWQRRLDAVANFLDESCARDITCRVLDAAFARHLDGRRKKSVTQLLGRHPEHALEVSGQMALVRESHGAGNFSQRTIACPRRQQRTGAVDSHLHQILMG